LEVGNHSLKKLREKFHKTLNVTALLFVFEILEVLLGIEVMDGLLLGKVQTCEGDFLGFGQLEFGVPVFFGQDQENGLDWTLEGTDLLGTQLFEEPVELGVDALVGFVEAGLNGFGVRVENVLHDEV
jgi:hypothetical protein